MFGYEPSTSSTKTLSKPKFKKISHTLSPFEVFSKTYKHYDYSYLLESLEGPRKLD